MCKHHRRSTWCSIHRLHPDREFIQQCPLIETPWLKRRLLLAELRALSALRIFSKASSALESCVRLGVHASALKEYFKSLPERLAESKGRFKACELGSWSLNPLPADYIGPIAVAQDPVKGRIMVTTRQVKAGELLLYAAPGINITENTRNVLANTLIAGAETCDTVIKYPAYLPYVVRAIMDDPSLGRSIHCLCPEPATSTPTIGTTDEERLQIFHKPTEIDIDLIDRQILRNGAGDLLEGKGAFNLQLMSSMISHSCRANVCKIVPGENRVSQASPVSCSVGGTTTY